MNEETIPLWRKCPQCGHRGAHTAKVFWGRLRCEITCKACGVRWIGRAADAERADEPRIVHVLRLACERDGGLDVCDMSERGIARKLRELGFATLSRGAIREPLHIDPTEAGRQALASGWSPVRPTEAEIARMAQVDPVKL